MRRIAQGLDLITTLFSVIAGIAVTLLVLHVSADVFSRSALGHTLPGTIPAVANYYMVLIVCLPLAFVERKNAHISVDVLTNLLPKGFTVHLFGWTYLFTALIFGFVAYASWIEALAQFGMGKFVIEQDIKIIIWIGYFAVPLGYGLGALYAFLKFLLFLTGRYREVEEQSVDSQVERLSHD